MVFIPGTLFNTVLKAGNTLHSYPYIFRQQLLPGYKIMYALLHLPFKHFIIKIFFTKYKNYIGKNEYE